MSAILDFEVRDEKHVFDYINLKFDSLYLISDTEAVYFQGYRCELWRGEVKDNIIVVALEIGNVRIGCSDREYNLHDSLKCILKHDEPFTIQDVARFLGWDLPDGFDLCSLN